MKNLILSLAIILAGYSTGNGQEWMPMVVNSTGYVPYQYSVTNYYTEWKPVNIPVVKYFPIQPQTYVQPVFFVQPQPKCLCWWHQRPYYYVYPNVYQYVPPRY